MKTINWFFSLLLFAIKMQCDSSETNKQKRNFFFETKNITVNRKRGFSVCFLCFLILDLFQFHYNQFEMEDERKRKRKIN